MKRSELYKLLIKLGLQDSVFVRQDGGKLYGFEFHPDIQNKISRINPDAVYVFNDKPLILFFDLTNLNLQKEAEIHKKVWSFDNSPIIFIIKKEVQETDSNFLRSGAVFCQKSI